MFVVEKQLFKDSCKLIQKGVDLIYQLLRLKLYAIHKQLTHSNKICLFLFIHLLAFS